MLPYDDALLYMQRAGQDNTAAALTFLKAMYNVGYQKILAEFGRQVTEKTMTLVLTPGQRGYTVPPDCLFPKTLELLDGTTSDPIVETASDTTWTYLKSGNDKGRPSNFHFRPRFGVNGGVLELYPVPSSAYILNFVYEGNDKNLGVSAYSTGSVALVRGSTAVVGTGTTFTAAMFGRYLIPTDADSDQMAYRISGYTSATSITLESAYNGTTDGSTNFRVVEIPALPQDMHILPCYFSLQEWWSSKGNVAKSKEFDSKFLRGMQIAKKTHSTVTRGGIVNPELPLLPFPQYPVNYPTSIN